MLAGHTLADDLGVLVNENVRTSFISVSTTGGHGTEDRVNLRALLEQVLGDEGP